MPVGWTNMIIITTHLGESSFIVGGGNGASPKNPATSFTKLCPQMGVTAAAPKHSKT